MQILKGHRSGKRVWSLAFSPDNMYLASSAGDFKTLLWDLSAGKYQVIDNSDTCSVAFSPAGRRVASGRLRGVSVWDRETGELRTIESSYEYRKVAFSPDGRVLIATGQMAQLWDVETLDYLGTISDDDTTTRCLAFTPDGRLLAMSHESRSPRSRSIRLWDTATWQQRDTLTGHTAFIAALAFSPDGRFLAACAEVTLWVWDVASRTVVVRHKISKQHFKDVAFSPDGRFLAFARCDATVALWDTTDWKEVAAYDWEIGPMYSIAFAPDGMRAAGGSGKGKVVVWDIDL
jgi:WD40 repeat protein